MLTKWFQRSIGYLLIQVSLYTLQIIKTCSNKALYNLNFCMGYKLFFLQTSWKYNFSDCDWFTNIAYFMGKAKMKQLLLHSVSHDASVLHDYMWHA